MEQIIAFFKENKILAIILGAGVVLLLFGKKLFRATPRRRRKTTIRPARRRNYTHRRHVRKAVGIRRSPRHRKHTTKKPWQVKGSEAARRHMAKLRRMR